MNCPEAEELLFAARDGALDENRRAALAEHVGQCRACRTTQAVLAQAADAWRSRSAAAVVPSVEPEWRQIRERIRTEKRPSFWGAPWFRPVGWGLGAVAAAAVALAVFLRPEVAEPDRSTPGREWTYVSYVSVEAAGNATMVYEDPGSGWLVVWVGDAGATTGG